MKKYLETGDAWLEKKLERILKHAHKYGGASMPVTNKSEASGSAVKLRDSYPFYAQKWFIAIGFVWGILTGFVFLVARKEFEQGRLQKGLVAVGMIYAVWIVISLFL